MQKSIALFVAIALSFVVQLRELQAQQRVEVEAVRGEPFGVGRITLAAGGGDLRINLPLREGPRRGARIADLARRLADQTVGPSETTTLETSEIALVERSGRIFYPVFEKRERPLLKEFVAVPKQTTAFFLFQGDAPLELTLYTPQAQTGQVVPRRDPAAFDRLLQAWWRDYSAAADGRNTPTDFPPLVEEYLVDTLGRRLQLSRTEPSAPQRPGLLFPAGNSTTDIFKSELSLLAGTEQASKEAARAILVGNAWRQPATEPLPSELPAPKPEVLNPAQADVEPLAAHVPVECFYVRFGRFPNFLWMRHRLEEWGGELRDIVSERGLNYNLNQRMERQLGLRQSKLAELFGEKVIADVAMIGTDTFLHEGAAIGVMFQAANSPALIADFTQQRTVAVKETKGAKLETTTIAGKPVSFISTPDNALRSFMASDGDFHLITTSRTIAEWFLQTGAGQHESLAASEDFRRARTAMPLARNDTVFAYFSPAFFQNLMSAHYQIELKRRLRSSVAIDLLRIARLAARGEGKQLDSVADLAAAGFLPEGFGQWSDGSHLVVEGNSISDSLRGGLGSFLPVPDVTFDKVTADELAEYRRVADAYTSSIGAIDPIMAGIRREELPEGKLERVILDLKAAPLSEQHSQMLAQWLGPATDQRLAPVEGDVVSFEAVLRGGTFFSAGDHHLFGALRDADPAIALAANAGLIPRLVTSKLEGLQGYVGAWPNPGFLKLLSGFGETQPDQAGYSRTLPGLWKRQFDQYTLVSFHPQILAEISPQLRFEKAERPAQVWIRADDLANSRLAPFINAFGYKQSREIALGNARYMNMLIEQLHVPAADAMTTAQQLVGAEILEPLGGKYELAQVSGGPKAWTSTSLAANIDPAKPPADYQFPALNWFRGVQLELMADSGLLAIHGEVIMPVETKPAPAFQLPKLPFGLGGGSDKARPAPKTPAPKDTPKPAAKRDF